VLTAAAADLERTARTVPLVRGQGGTEGDGPSTLLILLLGVAAVSTVLALVGPGIARHRDEADGVASIGDQVLARLEFAERRRVELAGVAAASLLVAVLLAVGFI